MGAAAVRTRGSCGRWAAVASAVLLALTAGGAPPTAGQEPTPRPIEGNPSADREIAQEHGAPTDPPSRDPVAERLRKFALESVRSQGSAMSVGAGQVPGTFRVMMAIPGGVGPEVKLDVVSLGPQGGPIAPAGDPALYPDLPPPALVGENGLVLRRMQDEPWQEGFSRYLSETVVVVADLRASLAYQRTAAESTMCVRCDAAAEGIPADARELLSGYAIQIRPSPELRQSLSGIYSDSALREMEQTIPSVPWDLSPSVRQEPRRNPSMGSGEVAPGTLLHSGEFSYTVTDLAVRGRGIDVAFTRTYRSGTVGSGPLGPGWELGYSVRLRELINGDVEYYDGRGRRELFVKDGDLYRPPPGFFADLSRTPSGWVLIDAQRNLERFDRWGQRIAIADAVKDSEDTGNEIRFGYSLSGRLLYVQDDLGRNYALSYDSSGRISSISDFAGRTVTYGYDAHGRLSTVTSPAVTVGETAFPSGLTTTYTYETPSSSDLATQLNARDNLTAITDARGETWLELDYTDADGDGRADEVTGQTWGGQPLSIAYDFGARTATVTDRRGFPWVHEHDGDGHAVRTTDPASAVWETAHDAEGLVTLERLPLGRTTTYTYDTGGDFRARGNLLSMTVTPDGRGTNGSSASLTTTFTYHGRTNLPETITAPRGAVTAFERDDFGQPLKVTRAQGQPEESVTELAYNAFGQLTRVSNPNGHVTEYRYETSGPEAGYLERQIVDPEGLALATRYETDPLGRVTAMIDRRGVRHETVYNELGWMVEQIAAATPAQDGSGAPALGYRTVYLYDEAGNLIERRDPIGDGTEHASIYSTYGVLGELLTTSHTVQPGGQLVQTVHEYDAGFLLERTTDPVGTVTEWLRDGRGLPASMTAGVGTAEAATEGYAHDLDGQLVTRTDARGLAWVTEYDGYGRPAAAVDPLGNRSETRYGDDDQPVERRHLGPAAELLARSGSTYDLLGRQVEAKRWLWTGTDPSGAREIVTAFGYDDAGNLLTTTDPLARVTSRAYDAAERLARVTDPVGNVTTLTRDEAGNATRVVVTEDGPAGSVPVPHDFGFDALGRQLWREDALGNRAQIVWDARSNAAVSIDPEGHLTSRVFDSLDRLVTETQPEGIEVTRGYDPASRLEIYTDALGHTTSYDYDPLGRQTAVTYPDSTAESYGFDPAGNLTQVTQPTGSVVTFTYDDASRRIGRTVAPGAGVVGAVSEAYTLDGLGRLVEVTSGTVTVTRGHDSLSRLASETVAGRTVTYGYDDAGSVAGMTYPSGHSIVHGLDALGRPETIASGGSPAAAYTFRGMSRVAGKSLGGGALSGSSTFDPAGRMLERSLAGLDGLELFGERLSWSPRDLKTAQSRTDRNGRGLAIAHDGAGRLVLAAELSDPAASIPNNTAPSAGTLADAPDVFSFAYDPAQNLLAKGVAEEGVTATVAMPADSSGRNRPASIDGVPLAWDSNGNLAAKGDLRFAYDDRNRLTRVTDAGGAEIARYEYDSFNRKVKTVSAGTTEETVWAGWQAAEVYRDGQLRQRRTWGLGLDEAVRLETDLDGDGTLETTHLPVYDSIGNLVAVTTAAGKPIERYQYSPFGQRRIFVDSTPPAVEQVRVVGGEIWVEVSEAVAGQALAEAVADGSLRLNEAAGGTAIELAVLQPVTEGRQAGRRLVLTPATVPAAGTEVVLTIAPEALVDGFLNRPVAAFAQTFLWPAADAVIVDGEAPKLQQVLVRNGFLEIQLSEEPDLAAAATAIQLDGATVAWALGPDRYTLVSAESLAPGSHDLEIGAGGLDLAGQGLDTAFSATLGAQTVSGTSFVFRQPDPREVSSSSAGNGLGFHGLEADAATGLVYVRNRWLDSEMGRFITTDPMGYADSPSLYQYAGSNPVDLSDPMGLLLRVTGAEQTPLRNFYGVGNVFFRQVGDDLYEVSINEAGLAHIDEYVRRTRGSENFAWHLNDAILTPFFEYTSLRSVYQRKGKWIGQEYEGARLPGMVPGHVIASPRETMGTFGGPMGIQVPIARYDFTFEYHRDALINMFLSPEGIVFLVAVLTPVGGDEQLAAKWALPRIGRSVSLRQLRHVRSTPQWTAGGMGGYFNSRAEAQAVLDAFHSGAARVLGRTKQGHVVVEYKGVTGFNNNPGAGYVDQPTNKFMIKGASKPSVVPISPSWSPPG